MLVFDGGSPDCSRFAALCEWRSGIAGLSVCEGRADHGLRRELAARGYPLAKGAVLLLDEQVLHGSSAIQWLCVRMQPSSGLLRLLVPLFAAPQRARLFYPLLLLARRWALALRGLPLDPDAAGRMEGLRS
ncbi:MAG: hypothetical protein VKI83_01300 [Synechococcaceae cyanobacterium]|nr:hypothetical protein [Synechococcaceae cyanobacterium]